MLNLVAITALRECHKHFNHYHNSKHNVDKQWLHQQAVRIKNNKLIKLIMIVHHLHLIQLHLLIIQLFQILQT